MIDTLISSGKNETITGLTINKKNIFVYEGKIREAGIIENMAQTAAARAGYEAFVKKEKVRTGYIGSVKNLSIYALPGINETLKTVLTPVSDVENISVVKLEASVKERKIAECTMIIILAD